LFINYQFYLSLNYRSFKVLPVGFIFQQDGAPAHSAPRQNTEVDAGQLSRCHHKGPVAFKFAGYPLKNAPYRADVYLTTMAQRSQSIR